MSAHVASELNELFQRLQIPGRVADGEDGLGHARQWLGSLNGAIGALLPAVTENSSAGKPRHVTSPFDVSLAVQVQVSSVEHHQALKRAWYSKSRDGAASSTDEEEEEEDGVLQARVVKGEENPHDFLLRWARAIDRHADLVASVVAAFSGSCLNAVRRTEVPRAVAEIRYWASRCPVDGGPTTPVLCEEETATLPRTCQLFLTSPAAALYTITHEAASAFASGLRSRRTARVIVSAAADTGAAPIAHLLVQLAHLDCPAQRYCPLASLPGLTPPAGAFGESIVIGDAATSAAVGATPNGGLEAVKVAPRSGARGVTIVCESADIFAAAEAAIEGAALWCAGQLTGSAHLVLVQESCLATFTDQLTERLSLRHVAATPLGDVGVLATQEQGKRLGEALCSAREDGADTMALGVMVGADASPLYLVQGAQPASGMASMETQEGVDGAFVYILPFRTAKEALKLANHAPRRLRASLWTEVPAQAAEMAGELKFRHVEVNCARPFDPRVTAAVDAPEAWLLRGGGGAAQAGLEDSAKPAPAKAAHGNSVFRSEKAQTSGIRSAVAASAKAAAKWSSLAPSDRRAALRAAVALLVKELTPEGPHLGELLMAAEDLAVGRSWPVKQFDFVGQVTIDRCPRGVVAILADQHFALARLCEAVLRALLFGNAVVLVTARAHVNALTLCGLGKLEAVSIVAYPEEEPNAASENVAVELSNAPGVAAILYATSTPVSRRLAEVAVSKRIPALCLERWATSCFVSAEDAELLRELCVQQRAIWSPVLDAFAN